jgi:hypothetical protein
MPDEIAFQNDPIDPAGEFRKQQNHFFVAERAASVDPADACGELLWRHMSLIQRVSYHQITLQLEDYAVWQDAPAEEYLDEWAFPFRLDFISPRCVRVRLAARPGDLQDRDSIMLERCEAGPPWRREDGDERATWHGPHGSIAIRRDPWGLELRDADGRLLTRTLHHAESPSVVNTNPMPRPLFFEFPEDPGSWLVEDQHLLGTGLLVAPLFEPADERDVYLPPGRWLRFDSGEALEGPAWHALPVEELPIGLLVRDGAALRLAEPAQHTGELDWEGAREWDPTTATLTGRWPSPSRDSRTRGRTSAAPSTRSPHRR